MTEGYGISYVRQGPDGSIAVHFDKEMSVFAESIEGQNMIIEEKTARRLLELLQEKLEPKSDTNGESNAD